MPMASFYCTFSAGKQTIMKDETRSPREIKVQRLIYLGHIIIYLWYYKSKAFYDTYNKCSPQNTGSKIKFQGSRVW